MFNTFDSSVVVFADISPPAFSVLILTEVVPLVVRGQVHDHVVDSAAGLGLDEHSGGLGVLVDVLSGL